MGEKFVDEGIKHYKPLAFAPRYNKDENQIPVEPVVVIDVRLAKRPAGCFICDQPIPAGSMRTEFTVRLPSPVTLPNGTHRLHEKFYAHSGCLTERVRPEVLRSRMSCYDCGMDPPQQAGHGLVYWVDRCFTVSKFAAAPLCPSCTSKPRWKGCDVCRVFFPHWMISETAESRNYVPAAHLSQYADLQVKEHQNICEYCAKRLGIPTVVEAETAREDFERLRREIAERGIFDAGDDL